MNYQILDHTADLQVQFFGKNKKELIKNSAIALSQIAYEIDLHEVENGNCYVLNITIKESDFSELYVGFLREILFKINTSEFCFFNVEFKKLTQTTLKARCIYDRGEVCKLKNEIKAVTYHDLSIKKNREGWSAKVIFDI